MRLPDGVRQGVAGVLAAGLFLGFYFGLNLIWWVALALAAAGYAAFLILIRKKLRLDELVLSEQVTAADIDAAGRILSDAGRRIGAAAERLGPPDAPKLAVMQDHLASILVQLRQDPATYRAARRLIVTFLPKMVANIETYADLARRAGAAGDARIADLRTGILGYGDVLERTDKAFLGQDLDALEAEVYALGVQLKRE
jgi:hypothetical protein